MPGKFLSALVTSGCVVATWATAATEASAPQVPAFNREVLPILAEHCFRCHGADGSGRKAGLRLDIEEGAKSTRPSGEAVIMPGHRSESLLYQRIHARDDERMPPPDFSPGLSEAEQEILGAWIDGGALWEIHWAYQPPKKRLPPAVKSEDWPRNEIDPFILARLEENAITPSEEADRRTLVRRLHLDLTGLPPSTERVEQFVQDANPQAYEVLVDALLDSPHFGEKWGRWWLDLAGYADSDGYLSDFKRPWAWRYREWVVDALNADMPFDQFTVEQLAGDLLPDATISQRIATGFGRNTTSNREGGADLEEYRSFRAADRVKSLGTVWMASTLECAQCHDHKYDPVTQRDFYQLYAFFDDVDEVNIQAPRGGEWAAFEAAWPAYLEARKALLAPVTAELVALQAQWEAKMLWAADHPGEGDYNWDRAWEVLGLIWGQDQGEGQLEATNIVRTPVGERSLDEEIRLQNYFLERGSLVDEGQFVALGVPAIREKLQELTNALPPVSRAPTLRKARVPKHSTIHLRGDFRSPGAPVEKRIPEALPPDREAAMADRLELAQWIVDPENPLTARVVVNRLWQELFGVGLVRTSDDFGVRGDRPTHPDLLDWLAVRFVEEDWHLKAALRRMVLSATYRQSSKARPELSGQDPGNRLLARITRARLSAELVRDTALAASGLLSTEVGGPSVRPVQPASVTKEGFDNQWVADEGPLRYRRGIYTFIQRTSPFGQNVNFDFPDTNRPCTRRERSNTPLQALNLLNDETFFEAARALAARTLEGGGDSDEERIVYAFNRCLARSPEAVELERLQSLLKKQRNRFDCDLLAARDVVGDTPNLPPTGEGASWVILSSVLLNLDEFVTKE